MSRETRTIAAKSRVLIALLAALAMVLAACGDADGDGANGDPDDDAATGEDAPDEGDEEEATTEADGDPEFVFVAADFNHLDSPEHRTLTWWMDTIRENSDGRIDFDVFAQESLCEGAEIVECVRDGRADVGQTIPIYTPDLFNFHELMNLPFMSSNPEAAAQAIDALAEEYDEVGSEARELGLEPMFYLGIDGAILGASDPMPTFEDLSGRSIRIVGQGSQLAVDAAGANPVSVTASEMYEGMQTGLLDVWTNLLSGADNFNMYEVSDYWYETGLGVYINVGTWMSQSAWESLPEDLQQVVAAANEELLAGAGYQEYGAGLQENCDRILEADNLEVWEEWPEEEQQAWQDEVGDSVVEVWIESVQDRTDNDPMEIYDRYVELLAEAEAGSEFVSPHESCRDSFNS